MSDRAPPGTLDSAEPLCKDEVIFTEAGVRYAAYAWEIHSRFLSHSIGSMSMNIGGKSGQQVPSHTGVKQGCPLSPTLFGLFADPLHRHLMLRCPGEGPQLGSGQRVPDLGYADDFVLMVSSADGLQRLIDAAVEFCAQVGMCISGDKTKVLVFCKTLPGPYQWVFAGSPLH